MDPEAERVAGRAGTGHSQLMAEAVAERLDDITGDVVRDLLRESALATGRAGATGQDDSDLSRPLKRTRLAERVRIMQERGPIPGPQRQGIGFVQCFAVAPADLQHEVLTACVNGGGDPRALSARPIGLAEP